MTEKSYVIGGKKYAQRMLVLGQMKQLSGTLQGVVVPVGIGADTMSVINVLGNKLHEALAIVLIPEGVEVRSKDLNSIASDLEFDITFEQIVAVVEDFFVCNPIASLLQKLAGTMAKVKDKLPKKETGSMSLSVSSPEAISPSETLSSGDSPQPSASPTLDTENGS